MRADITEEWPMKLVFLDRPREVIFCYQGEEIVRKGLSSGYWLYWVDKEGVCRVKQIY